MTKEERELFIEAGDRLLLLGQCAPHGSLDNRVNMRIANSISEMLNAQGMPLAEPRREGGSGASAPASPVGNADAPSPSPSPAAGR